MFAKCGILIPTVLLAEPKVPRKNKITQPWDKIQKQYSKELINWIFEYYNIDERIVNEKNIETNELNAGTHRLDYVGDSYKGATVAVEFQTNAIGPEDIKRFEEYGHALRLKYGNDIILYVFSMKPYPKKKITIDWGPGNTFTIYVINYADIPTNEILNNVEDKILNKQKLNDDDLLFLKVGFITSDNIRTYDLLAKMIKLVNKIETESKKEIAQTLSAYLTFADYLLTKKEYNKITGLVKMSRNIFRDILGDEMEIEFQERLNDMEDTFQKKEKDMKDTFQKREKDIKDTFQKRENNVRNEGITEGIKEVAKTMIENNEPINKIINYTKLPKKQINQLKQELNI